jgi:hypothetical protein
MNYLAVVKSNVMKHGGGLRLSHKPALLFAKSIICLFYRCKQMTRFVHILKYGYEMKGLDLGSKNMSIFQFYVYSYFENISLYFEKMIKGNHYRHQLKDLEYVYFTIFVFIYILCKQKALSIHTNH